MYDLQSIIKVDNLKKAYGKTVVLDGISFELNKGDIVGLLGPNGSGKTTLIKILTGLIKDHQGNVEIDGEKPGVHSKSLIAFLPDKSYLPDWMKPIDAINYFADFFADFDKEKAIEIMPRFGVDLNQRLKTMSKGQQEKLQLLLVMCRNARIYILDEPMGGVDPAARDFILETILKNRPEGSTILMSTHLIQDVEEIFDSILMIRQGQVRIQDSVENLTKDGKTINDLFKEVFSVDWNF